MSADARRAELLQAALRVMSRDGVAAGTTRAIVAEAGMPLATFHYCFRSRNELLRELITLVTTMERDAAAAAMAGDDATAATRAPAVPRRCTTATTSARRSGRGCAATSACSPRTPATSCSSSSSTTTRCARPSCATWPIEQYRRYYDTATQLLVTAAEVGGMRWTVELPVLARLVVTLTDGATTTWLADRDTDATLAALDLAADYVAGLATPR